MRPRRRADRLPLASAVQEIRAKKPGPIFEIGPGAHERLANSALLFLGGYNARRRGSHALLRYYKLRCIKRHLLVLTLKREGVCSVLPQPSLVKAAGSAILRLVHRRCWVNGN